jgi:molybdopterin/thiamine biosynthesis adenylyltransferase
MKNVQSQFHSKPSVGKLKVDALKKQMQFLYGIKINTVGHKLVADNVDNLLGGSDLIIDCLDNGDARRLVQGYVRNSTIPCLHGALAAGGAFGRVIWDEGFVIDDEDGDDVATCEDGEFLPFIGITASYLARSAQLFLSENRKVGFSISPTGVISV